MLSIVVLEIALGANTFPNFTDGNDDSYENKDDIDIAQQNSSLNIFNSATVKFFYMFLVWSHLFSILKYCDAIELKFIIINFL